jgi:hypothetical protein
MNQTYIASADYIVIDRAPLSLAAGQVVQCGKQDIDWPGWIWVTAESGRGSYVPEDILDVQASSSATVKRDFRAHDLSVKKQEQVRSLQEVKGWHWCQSNTGEEGWLPAYLLVPVEGVDA